MKKRKELSGHIRSKCCLSTVTEYETIKYNGTGIPESDIVFTCDNCGNILDDYMEDQTGEILPSLTYDFNDRESTNQLSKRFIGLLKIEQKFLDISSAINIIRKIKEI